jgi:hypothetical protein
VTASNWYFEHKRFSSDNSDAGVESPRRRPGPGCMQARHFDAEGQPRITARTARLGSRLDSRSPPSARRGTAALPAQRARAEGASNAAIAAALVVTVGTVKKHVFNVCAKPVDRDIHLL